MVYVIAGVGWLIGMIFYIKNTSKERYGHRCNVKRQVIQFKKINNQIGEMIRKPRR